MLESLFFFEIFTFSPWLFDKVEKRLDKRAMVNFKIYDVTYLTPNNYNTHITQYTKN